MKPTAAGFITGTPVLTAAGEVAIELVAPGMMVVSRPEDSFDLIYCPVVRVCTQTSSPIVAITYVDPIDPDAKIPTFAGGNQLFWADKQGWVAASDVRPGHELRGADDRLLRVSMTSPVYCTETPGVGWYQLYPNYGELGNDIDFGGPSWRLVKSRTSRPNDEFVNGPLLAIEVHDIELAGCDAYSIGPAGVWVRSTQCG